MDISHADVSPFNQATAVRISHGSRWEATAYHAEVLELLVGRDGHDPAIGSEFFLKLAEFLRATPPQTASEPARFIASNTGSAPRPGGLAKWQLRKTLEHIDANLAMTIRIETMATLVRLSSGYFSRAFKISVGETPHHYVIRQRVRRAQILMASSPRSLSEIALACGFTDQAHMTRHFTRHVKMTPYVWRRTFQEA